MSKLAKDYDEGLFFYFFDVEQEEIREQVGELIEARKFEQAKTLAQPLNDRDLNNFLNRLTNVQR